MRTRTSGIATVTLLACGALHPPGVPAQSPDRPSEGRRGRVAEPAPTETIAELRVMSFNLRYGTAADGENAWPNRRELVIEVIEGFGPAVLGVQEALAFQLDELSAGLPGFRVVGVGREDGARAGEFAAILVDTATVEVVDHGTFWFSDAPGTPGSTSWGNRIPRICTWARLRDRASGRHFYVYNVHWDHESRESRERSAGLLIARLRDRAFPREPVLVTGDFNAGESDPSFRRLVGAEAGLRDTFRDVHPEAAAVGTFHGFEGRTGGEKIDGILASGAWCTRSAEILRTSREGRYPSDHFPVVAVVATGEGKRCPDGAGRDPARGVTGGRAR